MQNLKKYALFVLMAVFVSSLAIAPANAQSGLVANVPFNFVVGKITMKAGSYRVQSQGGFVSVSGEGQTSYVLLLPGGDAADRNGNPYLIFTRFGSESFLNKVVFSSDSTYDLPLTSRQKELANHQASGEQVAVLIEPVR